MNDEQKQKRSAQYTDTNAQTHMTNPSERVNLQLEQFVVGSTFYHRLSMRIKNSSFSFGATFCFCFLKDAPILISSTYYFFSTSYKISSLS